MELSKPPPIRRLSGREGVVTLPQPVAAPAGANGYGGGAGEPAMPPPLGPGQPATPALLGSGQPAAAPFVATGRRVHPTSVAIDRMAVESLTVSYGRKTAVNSVSLPIRQGEVLALIGPSGCGKTTLLRSLNRLTELTRGTSFSGAITLDGTDISLLEPTELRRRVTMVFQQPNPFPMSVFDNVAYVLREQARRRPRRKEIRGAVHEALARAGLLDEVADNLDHPALRLSGGQQQRLCIARALVANPEVLLLDEPCSALDPVSTKVIEDLIVKLRDDVAVVIVTHNLQQAYRVADYVAFMYLGELVEYGRAGAVFAAPRQERTREYVGGAFG